MVNSIELFSDNMGAIMASGLMRHNMLHHNRLHHSFYTACKETQAGQSLLNKATLYSCWLSCSAELLQDAKEKL